MTSADDEDKMKAFFSGEPTAKFFKNLPEAIDGAFIFWKKDKTDVQNNFGIAFSSRCCPECDSKRADFALLLMNEIAKQMAKLAKELPNHNDNQLLN